MHANCPVEKLSYPYFLEARLLEQRRNSFRRLKILNRFSQIPVRAAIVGQKPSDPWD